MTPEEQRIAIARECGWVDLEIYHPPPDPERDYKSPRPFVRGRLLSESGCWQQPPDYLSDLNARREAWNALSEAEKFGMRPHLHRIAHRENIWEEEADFDFWPEAFLRAKGLWKE